MQDQRVAVGSAGWRMQGHPIEVREGHQLHFDMLVDGHLGEQGRFADWGRWRHHFSEA